MVAVEDAVRKPIKRPTKKAKQAVEVGKVVADPCLERDKSNYTGRLLDLYKGLTVD